MSDAVVKTVGRKLKYYFDVKRLEDGFDLSGVNSPQLDHPPLKSRPTLQYDGLHDRALKHYFSLPEVRQRLTKMDLGDEYAKEVFVKRKLKKTMLRYNFLPSTLPEYCYVETREGRKLNREMVEFKRWYCNQQKNKPPLKGGWPQLRSVPARNMSTGEAHRLVNAATKILIATEAVDGVATPKSTKRPQSAPSPFELRPTPGKYTWDIHGRRHRNIKCRGGHDESADSAYTTRTSSLSSDHQRKKVKEDQRPVKEEQQPVKLEDQRIDDIFLSPPSQPRPKTTKRRIHIINRDTPADEDVLTNTGTQTQDNVGIQTEKRLIKDHDPDEEEVKQGDWGEYQIYVRTGSNIGASTKADIKLTVYGDKGRSKEFYLDRSKRHKITFQKGKEDLFMKAFPHVGKLKKIKIGHDRTELSYAWFLESVVIYDMRNKRVYDFHCNQWLSGQDGDRRTYRLLPVSNDRAFIEKLEEESDGENRRRRHSSSSSSSSESSATSHNEEKNHGTKVSILVRRSSKPDDGSESDSSTSSSSSSSSSSSTAKGRPLSPVKPPEKDEFFDVRGQGPTTFTFREHVTENGKKGESSTDTSMTPKHVSVESTSETESSSTKPEQEFMHGYKIGLEAVEEENRKKKDTENEERKKVLRGPTIHSASKIGSLRRVQELLQYFPEMISNRDERGYTALHVASKHGQLEIVKWLAVNGASLNEETPTGYTPIHLAAMSGQVNCLMVLAALGAAITCRSADKKTPLYLAAMEGHLECVKWLIANRARLDVKDDMGRTPREVAQEYGHTAVAEFLTTCEDEMKDPHSGFAQMRTTEKEDEVKSSPKETKDMWKDEDTSKLATEDSESEDEKSRSSQKELEEKKKLYEEQQKKREKTGESFLDSIRNEL